MARMGVGSGIVACALLACIGTASAVGSGGVTTAQSRRVQELSKVVSAVRALRPPGAVLAVTGESAPPSRGTR